MRDQNKLLKSIKKYISNIGDFVNNGQIKARLIFMRGKQGFTLIELMVVLAIIALVASMALIGLMASRQKSRDVKRLADITQMATALELYFNANRGYPSSPVAGVPTGLAPGYTASIPVAPFPPDGGCELVSYPPGGTGLGYYYFPTGTPINGLYPEYLYYFCLGNATGGYGPGIHYLSPKGLR